MSLDGFTISGISPMLTRSTSDTLAVPVKKYTRTVS